MRIRVWMLVVAAGVVATGQGACRAPADGASAAQEKDSTARSGSAVAAARLVAPPNSDLAGTRVTTPDVDLRGALAAPSDSTRPRTLLFVGTSLTAGLGLDPDSAYPARIQRKLDAAGLPFRAVNAGVSGETSAGALQRMGWLLRQPVSVLVLETGANDGLRGTPVSETRANIQAIIDTVRRVRPGARIVLVQMEAPPNLGARYTREFHDTYPLLAQRNHLPLLPFLLAGVAGHAGLNQADGLHPNNAGERIVAATVWRALRPVLDSVVH